MSVLYHQIHRYHTNRHKGIAGEDGAARWTKEYKAQKRILYSECVADGEYVVTVSMREAKCMKASSSDEFGKSTHFFSRNVAACSRSSLATLHGDGGRL